MLGEITIVGPALSSLDADLAFRQEAVARSKDARKQAQMNAAAQEARGMLGGSLITPAWCCCCAECPWSFLKTGWVHDFQEYTWLSDYGSACDPCGWVLLHALQQTASAYSRRCN